MLAGALRERLGRVSARQYALDLRLACYARSDHFWLRRLRWMSLRRRSRSPVATADRGELGPDAVERPLRCTRGLLGRVLGPQRSGMTKTLPRFGQVGDRLVDRVRLAECVAHRAGDGHSPIAHREVVHVQILQWPEALLLARNHEVCAPGTDVASRAGVGRRLTDQLDIYIEGGTEPDA